MQVCQAAVRTDSKDDAASFGTICTGAPKGRRPVKVAVTPLKQSSVWKGSIASTAERIKIGQGTIRADSEYGASTARSPLAGCPVEIAVATLDKTGKWQ